MQVGHATHPQGYSIEQSMRPQSFLAYSCLKEIFLNYHFLSDPAEQYNCADERDDENEDKGEEDEQDVDIFELEGQQEELQLDPSKFQHAENGEDSQREGEEAGNRVTGRSGFEGKASDEAPSTSGREQVEFCFLMSLCKKGTSEVSKSPKHIKAYCFVLHQESLPQCSKLASPVLMPESPLPKKQCKFTLKSLKLISSFLRWSML